MLPGKAIANPKEYVQAITLKSGRVLPERVVPSRSNEDVAIQEEEESVDIEAEERVEKESVEPEPEKQRQRTRSRQKETRRGGKLFLFPTIQTNAAFSNTFQETNGREMQKVFDQQLSEINLKIPFVDALMMIKPYQKFLKDEVKAWWYCLKSVVL
ncbi:unnamed protein product [Microthlaspi erraticum]|uniref:Retrotransposon gag domain-containing protein n=1 Tax=Microthlaspi erraticum TaxID=1685480 RepID=A0A6D2KN36_9BRAS|nr:unnamed protein product [Microthlaspi erraticum]